VSPRHDPDVSVPIRACTVSGVWIDGGTVAEQFASDCPRQFCTSNVFASAS
jgi:hypothetical protein